MSTNLTRAPEAQSSPSPLTDNERALFDIIDDERMRLQSVLGSLRCLETALQAQNPPDSDEIEGALSLAREELRNVIDQLDEVNLLRTTRKIQPVPAAAEEAQSWK